MRECLAGDKPLWGQPARRMPSHLMFRHFRFYKITQLSPLSLVAGMNVTDRKRSYQCMVWRFRVQRGGAGEEEVAGRGVDGTRRG